MSGIFRYIKRYEYGLPCNSKLRSTLQFRNVNATLALSKSLTMQLGTSYRQIYHGAHDSLCFSCWGRDLSFFIFTFTPTMVRRRHTVLSYLTPSKTTPAQLTRASYRQIVDGIIHARADEKEDADDQTGSWEKVPSNQKR